MNNGPRGLSITAGALAAGCAGALAIVVVDMIVDDWLTPVRFGTASIIIELVLAATAAVFFFMRRPLWGLIASAIAFGVGEILGRTVTDGFGIFWPFVNLTDLSLFSSYISPLYAAAVVMQDLAFVLIVLTLVIGLIATIMSFTAASSPQQARVGTSSSSVQQGIPAGWYPDPDGKPCQRYWDGSTWTESTAPLG